MPDAAAIASAPAFIASCGDCGTPDLEALAISSIFFAASAIFAAAASAASCSLLLPQPLNGAANNHAIDNITRSF